MNLIKYEMLILQYFHFGIIYFRINRSMYHAVAYSSIMCIQALLKFDRVWSSQVLHVVAYLTSFESIFICLLQIILVY